MIDLATAIAAEVQAIRAEHSVTVATDTPSVTPTASRFKLLSDVELEELPPITYLVQEMIPAGGLAAMYGAPGAGKSFLALDLACCIAAGCPWLGRRTRQGGVVYVAAEGVSGLRQRMNAWKAEQGISGVSLDVHFLVEPLNLLAPGDAASLIGAIADLPTPPALIIIDTMHRSMPGGDENSAKDVGVVIGHVDRIRRATGATVLLVHHTGKNTKLERGSSALRGAVDALLYVDDSREVRSEKAKDCAPFASAPFELIPVGESCIVRRVDPAVRLSSEPIGKSALNVLVVLARDFAQGGARSGEWQLASRVPSATFQRARKWLVQHKYVSVAVSGGTYVANDSGRRCLAINYHGTITELSRAPSNASITLSEARSADRSDSEAALEVEGHDQHGDRDGASRA